MNARDVGPSPAKRQKVAAADSSSDSDSDRSFISFSSREQEENKDPEDAEGRGRTFLNRLAGELGRWSVPERDALMRSLSHRMEEDLFGHVRAVEEAYGVAACDFSGIFSDFSSDSGTDSEETEADSETEDCSVLGHAEAVHLRQLCPTTDAPKNAVQVARLLRLLRASSGSFPSGQPGGTTKKNGKAEEATVTLPDELEREVRAAKKACAGEAEVDGSEGEQTYRVELFAPSKVAAMLNAHRRVIVRGKLGKNSRVDPEHLSPTALMAAELDVRRLVRILCADAGLLAIQRSKADAGGNKPAEFSGTVRVRQKDVLVAAIQRPETFHALLNMDELCEAACWDFENADAILPETVAPLAVPVSDTAAALPQSGRPGLSIEAPTLNVGLSSAGRVMSIDDVIAVGRTPGSGSKRMRRQNLMLGYASTALSVLGSGSAGDIVAWVREHQRVDVSTLSMGRFLGAHPDFTFTWGGADSKSRCWRFRTAQHPI